MEDSLDWRDLAGLTFVARRLVEGLYAGRHLSPHAGPGIDFHDYRPYVPGDDPSSVDWRLFGRTDRLHVRRHRRPTNLTLYLMLDVSASMRFAGVHSPTGKADGKTSQGQVTKLKYAATLAAAMAWLAMRQGDRVSVALLADRVGAFLPPGGSPRHMTRAMDMLAKASDQPGVGDLGQAMHQAHAIFPHRGIVVLLSDLIDPPGPFFEGLSRFRHDRFEAMVFQVLSPAELTLQGLGRRTWLMVDPEHPSDRLEADAAILAAGYTARLAAHLETVRRGCLAQHADHALVRTDQPLVAALTRHLARRARG